MRIDALAAEGSEGDRGKTVAPYGAGEHYLGSGSARRQRLISAFAAREQFVGTAEHGLPRLRQAWNRDDQIGIYRPEGQDHGIGSCSGCNRP